MKQITVIFGGVLVAFVVGVGSFMLLIGSLFHVPYPPQPKFGFTGNWRTTNVFGFDERPLPPAQDVWRDYSAWNPTNAHGSRHYLGRLGGVSRQSGFRSWVSSGDTPMGAQRYTHVEFIYSDPTNGTYNLSWYLRGEHDPDFLRFDDSYRLYQLQPYGTPGEVPPKLSIVGIEGIRPEHYVGP